jgi:hypothetical protein
MEIRHEFSMDEKSYAELLTMLNNMHLTEKSGADHDLGFIYEDWWLGDTAVIDNLALVQGAWEIYSSKQKAELTAFYMRRLAAKDQRGTLCINANDFIISVN